MYTIDDYLYTSSEKIHPKFITIINCVMTQTNFGSIRISSPKYSHIIEIYPSQITRLIIK